MDYCSHTVCLISSIEIPNESIQTDVLASLKIIYGDFELFLPKNSPIFIGQGLSKTVTGLSIQGDDLNLCNFLMASNRNLIQKVCPNLLFGIKEFIL